MRKNFATALSLLLALLLSAIYIMAQQSKPLTESSFLRAQQVLHRGIEALGGLKNLQAIEDISYESEAQTTEIGQSTAPDAPYYLRPTSGEGVIDFRGKRSYRVTKTHFLGSAPFWLSI